MTKHAEQYRALSRSDANIRLNRIVANLKAMEDEVIEWFNEGHGRECDCDFCASPFCRDSNVTDGDLLDEDMTGLLYNLRTAQSILNGQTHFVNYETEPAEEYESDAPSYITQF